MDQLNVQLTWPTVLGLGKYAGNYTIKFIFHKDKLKDIRATYVRAV